MKIRIATFNCENLFARFKFSADISPEEASRNGFTINNLAFTVHDPAKRIITAKAIKAIKADVVVLQEVENLDVLKRFRTDFLGGFGAFPHVMLVDGNDPRFIDVAILSRHPIIRARSHQQVKASPQARSFVFSRDCLEADIDFEGKVVTLFANHFKSMIGGRPQTREKRLSQVQTVKKIIQERFGSSNPGKKPFVILGDFNDYLEAGDEGSSSLPELVQWNHVENVVARLSPDEQWTHYYSKGNEYRQLDYILVSKSLKSKVTAVEIERRGLPLRATRFTGSRFPGVGQDNPKASDHCPVAVELDV
jgi:endonuclease/exonuclease/phosphatase family metal-dependent hydrolase